MPQSPVNGTKLTPRMVWVDRTQCRKLILVTDLGQYSFILRILNEDFMEEPKPTINNGVVALELKSPPVNPHAAIQVVQQLVAAAEQLLTYPQLGERLTEFSPRNVRRLIVGYYELRYELTETTIFILCLWHGREDR